MLAKNAGLEIPREAAQDAQVSKQKDSLYSVLGESDKYFRQQLRQHQAAAGPSTTLKAVV